MPAASMSRRTSAVSPSTTLFVEEGLDLIDQLHAVLFQRHRMGAVVNHNITL